MSKWRRGTGLSDRRVTMYWTGSLCFTLQRWGGVFNDIDKDTGVDLALSFIAKKRKEKETKHLTQNKQQNSR